MPKTIKDRIKEIQGEPSATTLNVLIKPKIQALILKMVELDEWQEFINEFIAEDNSESLKKAQRDRLSLKGNLSDNPYVIQSAAYLFGNTVCTGTTRSGMLQNINGILDEEIDLSQ